MLVAVVRSSWPATGSSVPEASADTTLTRQAPTTVRKGAGGPAKQRGAATQLPGGPHCASVRHERNGLLMQSFRLVDGPNVQSASPLAALAVSDRTGSSQLVAARVELPPDAPWNAG